MIKPYVLLIKRRVLVHLTVLQFVIRIPRFPSMLIHIMLVLTLRTAKYIVGSAGDESLLTVFTEPQRFFLIGQHKAEYELNRHQQ